MAKHLQNMTALLDAGSVWASKRPMADMSWDELTCKDVRPRRGSSAMRPESSFFWRTNPWTGMEEKNPLQRQIQKLTLAQLDCLEKKKEDGRKEQRKGGK